MVDAAIPVPAEQPRDPVAVLSTLLGQLRDGKTSVSSSSAVTALALCEDISDQLRALIMPPAAAPLATACDSQCTTSESDSDSTVKGPSKNRPSARSRARLRRNQQQAQYSESQRHYDEWQQWQSQWRESQPMSQPLPGVIEQQEQHFRSSLWSGGWVVVPVAPIVPPGAGGPIAGATPIVTQSTEAMAENIANRGALVGHAPSMQVADVSDAIAFQQGMFSGGWQAVPATNMAATGTSAPTPFKERAQRCMKVYRWQRMQNVWTEWMRDAGSDRE